MIDKERFIGILSWSPLNFAKMSSDHLLAIQNSKRPWWRRNYNKTASAYYFRMCEIASNDNEIVAVVRYWLVKSKLPIYPHELDFFNHFHEKFQNRDLNHWLKVQDEYMFDHKKLIELTNDPNI